MKRSYKSFFILLLIPLLVGMGNSIFGEDPADKIPIPEHKFTAIYIDQMDVITECKEVSIQGKTFLEGKRGKGTHAIPFEKIKNILFVIKNGELKGRIQLKDKSKTELILKKDHKAYGHTKYGTFQIKLINLKKMILVSKGQKIKGN